MFEGIKRNVILNKINNHRYKSFMEARNDIIKSLGEDTELLELAIIKYEDSFMMFSDEEQERYFLAFPNEIPIDRLRESVCKKILKEHPEYIAKLNHSKRQKMMEANMPNNYRNSDIELFALLFNKLDFNTQYEMYQKESGIRKISYLLDKKLIFKYLISKLYNKGQNDWHYTDHIISYASEIGFENIPLDVKKDILKIDIRYASALKEEERLEIVKDNPYLRDALNKMKIKVPDSPDKEKGSAKGLSLLEARRVVDVYNEGMDFCKNMGLYYDNEWVHSGIQDIGDFTEIFRRNPLDLVEFARFAPNVMQITGSDDFKNSLRARHFIDYYKPITDRFPNAKEFDSLYTSYQQNFYRNGHDYYKAMERSTIYPKILFNNRIINSCNPSDILEILKDPSNREVLLRIVETAYGKNARDILEKRKELTVVEIPNFDIFNENIINTLGVGVVHNALSYQGVHSNVLGELGRNPNMLNRYVDFCEVTNGIFSNEAIDMERRMLAFYDFETNLKHISVKSLNKNQIESLINYLSDKFIVDGYTNHNICILSLEDLNNYTKNKNEQIDEAIKYVQDPEVLKDLLFQRFFGIKYNNNRNFAKNTLDVLKIIYRYNSKKFTENTKVIESLEFSDAELDILRLLNVINNINSSSALKDLYEEFKNSSNILTPQDLRSVVTKMDKFYSITMKDSLSTKDTFDKMVEENTQGISKRCEDGIDVYTLEGADFKMLVHNPKLNNSGIDRKANDTLNEWETFENGCSTISCCYIEPSLTDIYSSPGDICLGFYDFDYRQIAGMAPRDAHSDHGRRVINPKFEYNAVSYELPDELGRKTAAQIENIAGEQSDPTHKYNEVTLYRRFMDTSKIEGYSTGGRLMPDYIVCYKPTDFAKASAMAKAFSLDGKPLPIVEIDLEYYKKHTSKYQRAYEGYEEHPKELAPTDFIKGINDIVSSSKEVSEEELLESVGRSR